MGVGRRGWGMWWDVVFHCASAVQDASWPRYFRGNGEGVGRGCAGELGEDGQGGVGDGWRGEGGGGADLVRSRHKPGRS